MDPEQLTGPCQCAVCAAEFDSFEHLSIHLGSHRNSHPITCQFCEQPFTRSDALTRHMKTCMTRLEIGAPVPFTPQRIRGKKRKACDRCMKLKKACNTGLPCNTCFSRHQACVYTVSKQRRATFGNSQECNEPPDQNENDWGGLPSLDLGLTPPPI